MKKILGKISDDVIEKWHLEEHRDKKIVLYDDRLEHCMKHIDDYKNIYDYTYTIKHLKDIIVTPDYVYYDVNKHGLEYYKKLRNNILVAIRISSGNELKIRSVYPVTETKIKNRKKHEDEAISNALIDKYKVSS